MNLNLNISFEQLRLLIFQLPADKKIELARALDKEVLPVRFSKLLDSLKTSELSFEEITKEVEAVRAQRYARK